MRRLCYPILDKVLWFMIGLTMLLIVAPISGGSRSALSLGGPLNDVVQMSTLLPPMTADDYTDQLYRRASLINA